MQRVTLHVGLAFIIAVFVWDCAGTDLLDELNDTYQVSITLSGGEGDAPNDLEVFSLADCDGDPTTDDPEPGLAGISGTVTIVSSSDAPFVQIDSYSVEYIPQSSPLAAGGTDLPPELDATEILETTANITPGTTTSFVLHTVLTIDNKLNYWFEGGLATFAQGVYVVRVKLYGFQNEESKTFTVDTVVRLMDIDNC